MQRFITKYILLTALLSLILNNTFSQKKAFTARLVPVDSGWAQNSINAVSFRKNSLVTWRDFQFIAFYSSDSKVVVGKRQLGHEQWELRKTAYTGNVRDAHNSISIAVDGDGFVHLAWDHHNNRLHYAKGKKPGALELDTAVMTGTNEGSVTYPEFYFLKNGNLLFLHRDGQSGRGNLVVNGYDLKTRKWSRVHGNLIDGEGQRNPYWQCYVDVKGTIHLSWVWRESPDVASNHDMCYARSKDNGKTWQKLNGNIYSLPITSSTADYALRIPQNSELINQTSMGADAKGNPYIATYWKAGPDQFPQYHLIYARNKQWKHLELAFRKTNFSLSGVGTKSIPVARPQVLVRGKGNKANVLVLFRDLERNSKVSRVNIPRINRGNFDVQDLTTDAVGAWEPSYDTELWKSKKVLNVFVQKVNQADAEGLVSSAPTMIYVLEVN